MAWRGMSSTVSIMPASSSLSVGRTGAKVTPQLPSSAVVTPCQLTGVQLGSQPICASRWVWMSTKPGVTVSPSAAISRWPFSATLPIAAILPSLTATSPVKAALPVPSTLRPPRMTKSEVMVFPLLEAFQQPVDEVRRITQQAIVAELLFELTQSFDERSPYGQRHLDDGEGLLLADLFRQQERGLL